jgi:hypothetical protein
MRLAVALIRGVFATISLPGMIAAQTTLPGHVVDIKVGEYFILAPDSAPAGVITLRVTQTGDVVKRFPADTAKLRADLTYHFHMVWVVRLDSGRTVADLLEAGRSNSPAPWATVLGGAGFADAPGSSNATMTLPPGSYALVCYVGSARADRNRYHLLKGMVRPITVVGGTSSVPLPNPHLTVVLRDSSEAVPDTLRAGTYRILVRNEGKRPADFGISRLKPGYTIAQAKAWQARSLTEPPRHAVGGVIHVRANDPLMTTVELVPGDYFFRDKHVVVRE